MSDEAMDDALRDLLTEGDLQRLVSGGVRKGVDTIRDMVRKILERTPLPWSEREQLHRLVGATLSLTLKHQVKNTLAVYAPDVLEQLKQQAKERNDD